MRILVIGYFGYVTDQLDGQTIKTREVYNLVKERSRAEVEFYDSQRLTRKPLSVFQLISGIRRADIIIYLPGQNNLTYVFDLIWAVKRKNTGFIYPVVGGWLADFLEGKDRIVRRLKKFEFIGVETDSLKRKLEKKYGMINVGKLTNFRSQDYTPVPNPMSDQLRLVFMARIMPEKGCDTIFELADLLDKEEIDNVKVTFYGQIDPAYKDTFMKELAQHANRCSYGGVVQPKDVYSKVNEHDVMLLPTRYEGEGFPGTIVDAYKAGVPVIITRWKDLPEFVDEGSTGYIVTPGDIRGLFDIIVDLTHHPQKVEALKRKAFLKSEEYGVESGWKVLSRYLARNKSYAGYE